MPHIPKFNPTLVKSYSWLANLILAVILLAPPPGVQADGGCATPSFTVAANFGVGSNPQSVAVGDFNGDGRPDLTVANQGSATVSVLLGNGDGTFAPLMDFSVGLSPSSMAIGDLNGDGRPDLAVANQSSNTVSVLLGNGDGTFAPLMDFSVGTSPSSVAIGDLNGNGRPDLAVANQGSATVSVLLGNGDGTFTPVMNFGVGLSPSSVAVGDLNGDGKPDLAVANFGSDTVSVLLGNGSGSFGGATNFSVGSNPQSVAVGDLNGDGWPDLAVANNGFNNVSVLLNRCPVLTLIKSVNQSSPAPGQLITYTLVINNSGAGNASNAVISDTLPAGLTLAGPVSLTPPGAGQIGTPPSLVNSLTITAGQSVTVTFPVTVNTGLTNGTLITNTAAVTSAEVTMPVTGSVLITVTSIIRTTYLPLLLKNFVVAPDLIVDSLSASSNQVTVVIKNVGNAPVSDAFWVDVYLNPNSAPTGVNQRWQDVGSQGLVWGIQGSALPLNPTASLTLTIGDAYYWGNLSNFVTPLATGLPVYAQVDSVNFLTTYGGVLESHEIIGGAYNNISGTVSTAGETRGLAPVEGKPPSTANEALPPR